MKKLRGRARIKDRKDLVRQLIEDFVGNSPQANLLIKKMKERYGTDMWFWPSALVASTPPQTYPNLKLKGGGLSYYASIGGFLTNNGEAIAIQDLTNKLTVPYSCSFNISAKTFTPTMTSLCISSTPVDALNTTCGLIGSTYCPNNMSAKAVFFTQDGWIGTTDPAGGPATPFSPGFPSNWSTGTFTIRELVKGKIVIGFNGIYSSLLDLQSTWLASSSDRFLCLCFRESTYSGAWSCIVNMVSDP